MKSVKELRAQLAELDENIKRGLELEAEGYPCGFMVAMTRSLRAEVARELEEAERCTAKT